MVFYKPTKFMVLVSSIGLTVGGSVIFKEFIGGCRYKGEESLEGKTAIVTGANTGIGKEVAKEFAKRGCRVILACRDMEKCEKSRQEIVLNTKNKKVLCQHLDLSSLKSVREFAHNVNKSESSLHLLVNNAGVMRCPHTLTEDGFEMQLGVNHLGHFLLTNLLLDKLKDSTPSRIINVSSVAHKKGNINFDDFNSDKSYDPQAAYNQSKLANVLFTRELAKRIKGSGIEAYAAHPGIVNTEITRHMSFTKSYFASVFVSPLLWLIAKTPRQGAQTIIHCALSPLVLNHSGAYFSDCAIELPSNIAMSDDTANWLWLTSEKWTRLKL